MKITETNLGYLLETSKVTALFGGEKAQLINLKASYPETDFIRLKQTHSDLVIYSKDVTKDYQVEGDAHFTDASRTALCISTADCIPLLLFDEQREVVAAIHAGWRGVANEIVSKTFQRLHQEGSRPEHIQVFIGPHIQMASFEVGFDVRDRILKTVGFEALEKESHYHRNVAPEKALVDLHQVVKKQLLLCGSTLDHIYELNIDTFTDRRFHSFRRDKEKSGRQLSFIFKN